jgi:dTDP-4-amino-4,6-dideoxygalactose transaminase
MTRPAVPCADPGPREDRDAVQHAIERVLASGWFILGPEVEAFEREFAAAARVSHAVGVASGTDAITLILRALGIGAGDEVITTPLSAAYTAFAIMATGARPVFADVQPDRLTIDPAAVSAAVTGRTRAILPVHLYGQAADMAAIEAVAARHGLPIVEDCCQAHLATAGGRPVGAIGVAGAFSFYPTKNLGALGDAGAVVTNDARLAEKIRVLRNGGQREPYHHEVPAVHSRLDEMQAAILRARLPFLPRWSASRRTLAAVYRQALPAAPVTLLPECDPGHVYHLFVVRSSRRASLRRHLAARGIETLVHYPVPISKQRALDAQHPADCPTAAAACAEVLTLPLYPGLTTSALNAVAFAISEFHED